MNHLCPSWKDPANGTIASPTAQLSKYFEIIHKHLLRFLQTALCVPKTRTAQHGSNRDRTEEEGDDWGVFRGGGDVPAGAVMS